MSNRKWWLITAAVALVPGGLAIAVSVALYRHWNKKRQLKRCESELREMGVSIQEHAKWPRA